MKGDMSLSDDFCRTPPAKVFLLSLSTFGLYLVYWYEIQYAKSKKCSRSVFKDFLKSYFFIFCSFKLAEKINRLLEKKEPSNIFTQKYLFIAKFIFALTVEAIGYLLYSVHLFLIAILISEATYATILQMTINKHIPQLHDTEYPWQRFEKFHFIVLVGGMFLLLFLQFSHDPLSLFRR